MADFLKREAFLKGLEKYKKEIACKKCGCVKSEVKFYPLKLEYSIRGKLNSKNAEAVFISCSHCREITTFIFPFKYDKVQNSSVVEQPLKISCCRICQNKRYHKWSAVLRAAGTYEVCLCEDCGAAYFFEIKRVNYRIRGGFSDVYFLNRLAREFLCANCCSRGGIASQAFRSTFIGFENCQLISVSCPKCKYIQFVDDWDREGEK
jgi:hypothetical protein